LCIALWAAGWATVARAQPVDRSSPDELAAARSLFAEALRDEEAKRFAEALVLFQRVRAVRDTAPVEYRIGTCHEGLGQAVPAYTAYRQAIALGQSDERNAEVVAAALERLAVVERRVARLTLALPERAPADAQVHVDDAAVSRAELGEPIVLEPGPHVVTATAPGGAPSRSEVVVPEGGRVFFTVPLEPTPGSPLLPVPASHTGGAVETVAAPASAGRTAGWIACAGGGVLLVGSAAVLLVRASEIDKLNRDCPGGHCQAGLDPADLTSTRSRALVEGPVAAALAIAGALSVGAGAYLVLTTPDGSAHSVRAARVLPLVDRGAAGIAVAGTFQ
jgi:hypothetical protein